MLTFSANIDEATKARTEDFFTRTKISSYSNKFRELLAQGIDLHARDNVTDYTLLHNAVAKGSKEIVKLLLEHGAELHARTVQGDTPLQMAVFLHMQEPIPLLLAAGANVWAQDKDAKPLLDLTFSGTIQDYIRAWQPKLEAVKKGECDVIHITQDIYHLASVMKPENPKNIPHPKEFIRILFQQYLPHEPKFDRMYEEIFSQKRLKPLDLQSARKEAAAHGRGRL